MLHIKASEHLLAAALAAEAPLLRSAARRAEATLGAALLPIGRWWRVVRLRHELRLRLGGLLVRLLIWLHRGLVNLLRLTVRVGDVILNNDRNIATAASVLEIGGLNHRSKVAAVAKNSNIGESKRQKVQDTAAYVVKVAAVAAARAEEDEARASCAVVLRHGAVWRGKE